MSNTVTRYQIVDTHTGYVVGSANNRRAATNKADRKDAAYGAYRYAVVAVVVSE